MSGFCWHGSGLNNQTFATACTCYNHDRAWFRLFLGQCTIVCSKKNTVHGKPHAKFRAAIDRMCAYARHGGGIDSSRDTDTTQNKCPKYCVSLCFVNFPCYNMRIDIFKLRKRPVRGGEEISPSWMEANSIVETIMPVCFKALHASGNRISLVLL